MKTPIQGIDRILMVRKYTETAPAAARLALQISHEISESRSVESEETKDGPIVNRSGLETVISLEAVATRDETNKMLHDSVREGFMLEVWEVDMGAEPSDVVEGTSAKYPARYGRGYLSSWTTPANVGETVKISTELTIEGELIDGLATITDAQIEEMNVAFRDVTPQVGDTPDPAE